MGINRLINASRIWKGFLAADVCLLSNTARLGNACPNKKGGRYL